MISPSKEGLKFSVDCDRIIQSHLYIPKSFFRKWQWEAPDISDTQDQVDENDQNNGTICAPLQQLIEMLEFCRPPSSGKGLRGKTNDSGLFTLEWNKCGHTISLKFVFDE